MAGYVNSATGVLKKVLLCPPEHLSFRPINVITEKWLEQGESANIAACVREHAELVQAYRENGVEVELIKARPELPYQVFARDFGACISEGVIIGSFREPCRQGESAVYEEEIRKLGIPVVARCTNGCFEGGDFWMLDAYTIAHGIIARTDRAGFESVREQLCELGYHMVGVRCARENLHLDMCFNIVAEKIAVVCSAALPYEFMNMLKKRGFTLIDIAQEGVFLHHANLQCLGGGRVISFKNNRAVNERLRALGLTVIEPELSEILKAGGGPHCMTFPLIRE